MVRAGVWTARPARLITIRHRWQGEPRSTSGLSSLPLTSTNECAYMHDWAHCDLVGWQLYCCLFPFSLWVPDSFLSFSLFLSLYGSFTFSFFHHQQISPPTSLSFCSLLLWWIYRVNVIPSWSCSSSSFRQWVSGWPQSSCIPPCPLHHWFIMPPLFFLLPMSLSHWCGPAMFPKMNWAKRKNVEHQFTSALICVPHALGMHFVYGHRVCPVVEGKAQLW